MKRNTAGGSRVCVEKPTVTELKPLPTPREHIHDEAVQFVTGVTAGGDPIYVSKSYVAVGQSPTFVLLPHAPNVNAISADAEMLVTVGHGGFKLVVTKTFNFGAGATTTSFDLPEAAIQTALLNNAGQRTLIIAGNGMLQTMTVPMRPWGDVKPFDSRQPEGDFSNIVCDKSNQCCHVIYRSGEWFQVLEDGQIVERLPLPMALLGKSGRLLAADVMQGIFLYQIGTELTLCHGAVKFPIQLYVAEEERAVTLWGTQGMIYIQLGTADLVPSLGAIHTHTGAVLDTMFPTGVAPGTVREIQSMNGNARTLAYNNGIYVLIDRVVDENGL
jgi:hypothetical protein